MIRKSHSGSFPSKQRSSLARAWQRLWAPVYLREEESGAATFMHTDPSSRQLVIDAEGLLASGALERQLDGCRRLAKLAKTRKPPRHD